MKTEKELQELKEKVEALNEELKQLTDEELEQVSGGGRFIDTRAVVWTHI